MGAAFGGQRDLAGDPHLTAAGIGCTQAAGGDDPDLCSPAASEARHFRLEGGAGQRDLWCYGRVVGVHRETGSCPGQTIVGFQRSPAGERIAGVRRIHDVHAAARVALHEHLRIELTGRGRAARLEFLAPVPPVSVDYQKVRMIAHFNSLAAVDTVNGVGQIRGAPADGIGRRVVLVAVSGRGEQHGLHAPGRGGP